MIRSGVGGGTAGSASARRASSLGLGDVAAEGFEEILLQIAFGLHPIDTDGPRLDAVGTQLPGEPRLVDYFGFARRPPGAVGEIVEPLNDGAAEEPVGIGEDEGDTDIEEQRADGVGFVGGRGETDGSLAGGLRPMAAGEVGEDEERFPDVGGAVVQACGDFGAALAISAGVVEDEAGALAFEVGGIEVAEAFALFVGGFALHADDDAAVGEGFGQASDGGHDFGAPAGETGEAEGGRGVVGVSVWLEGWRQRRWRRLADADDVGGFAGVTGVEDAAEFVVALEEGVGFVDEQGGAGFFDDAEEGGGADVGGDDGAVDEFAEDGEEGGFAAAFFGGFEADVGADVAEVEGVGVEGPEGEGFGGPLGAGRRSGGGVWRDSSRRSWPSTGSGQGSISGSWRRCV